MFILMTISWVAHAATTFDYVIVGGGATGLALAVRLSEDPLKSVMVLEAGGTCVCFFTSQSFTDCITDTRGFGE